MARPLPTPDHESAEFWRRVGARALALQRCRACRTFRFYPRALCPECLDDDVEWVAASGRGTVYSYTVCHRAAAPAFAERVPYIIALIDLDEGVRIMANLVGGTPQDVRVGLPVILDYEDAGGVILYTFRPA